MSRWLWAERFSFFLGRLQGQLDTDVHMRAELERLRAENAALRESLHVSMLRVAKHTR